MQEDFKFMVKLGYVARFILSSLYALSSKNENGNVTKSEHKRKRKRRQDCR